MLEVYYALPDGAGLRSEDFIRGIARTCYGLEGEELALVRDDFGKPRFRDYPGLHFNLSHTEGLMVCGFSDKAVGLDAEGLTGCRQSLVDSYFAPAEQAYVGGERERQDKRFTEIWTMKEAWLKWRGSGIGIPLEVFNVLDKKIVRPGWWGRFCLAVCSRELEGEDPLRLRRIQVRNQALWAILDEDISLPSLGPEGREPGRNL